MALILHRWRAWLTFAVLGFALASACEGRWTEAVAAVALVLLRVAWLVRGQLLAAREMMRGQPAGRHAKPLAEAYTCSRCGKPGVTEWAGEGEAARGQMLGLDLVCDRCLVGTLRLAAARQGG